MVKFEADEYYISTFFTGNASTVMIHAPILNNFLRNQLCAFLNRACAEEKGPYCTFAVAGTRKPRGLRVTTTKKGKMYITCDKHDLKQFVESSKGMDLYVQDCSQEQ